MRRAYGVTPKKQRKLVKGGVATRSEIAAADKGKEVTATTAVVLGGGGSRQSRSCEGRQENQGQGKDRA
ncbi:hypothetical protein Dimus_008052, partial [Dionaea muscipula]